MLLPSIVKLLDQNQAQLKAAAPSKAKPPVSNPQSSPGLQTIEQEIAAAAELVKPSGVEKPASGPSPTGPFLEELLRAITKFEKSEQSRVVDVFE